MAMTGEQMRAARAMLRWEQSELAARADVSVKTVKRLEAMSGTLDARSIWSIKKAFELGGIEFLDANDFRGGGEGVRLQKDRTAMLRRKISEATASWLQITLETAVKNDEDYFERSIDEILDFVILEIRVGLKRSVEDLLRKE